MIAVGEREVNAERQTEVNVLWHHDLLGAGVNGRIEVINRYLGKQQWNVFYKHSAIVNT